MNWFVKFAPYIIPIAVYIIARYVPKSEARDDATDIRMDELNAAIQEHVDACNKIPKGELVEKINGLAAKMDLHLQYFTEHRLQIERDLRDIRNHQSK